MPERTETWLTQHEWRISMDWVAKMADKAHDKPIFLCGGAANESEICDLCDKVIWLKTNEATIRERVNNPRDHDYGTRSHELAAAIEANKRKEVQYRESGGVLIDATLPIDKVVKSILAEIQ